MGNCSRRVTDACTVLGPLKSGLGKKMFFLARNGLWQECWQHRSPYTWLDESLVFQLARFNYQEYQGLQHCSHHLKTLCDHNHDRQDGLPSQWSLISHLLLDQLLLEKRPDLLEPQFLVKYRLVKPHLRSKQQKVFFSFSSFQ